MYLISTSLPTLVRMTVTRTRWLDGITNSIDEFEQVPGGGEEQRSLACCSLWGCKESNTIEWLNNNQKKITGVRWYCIVILIFSPWWSMMLNVFSCTWCPFLHHLWKKISGHILCSFWNLTTWFILLLSCMSSLCILDINSLSDTWFANIFCHFSELPFHFIDGFLCYSEAF